MNEIVININEANKAQRYQNKNELFQIEAFEKVSKILHEHRVGKNTEDITDCRFHDTIFIDGDRGVGKTAFMINIEEYYNRFFTVEQNTKKEKYIFLKPVDPTLLEHTEKFLSVILAKIVEMVMKKLNSNCIDEGNYCIDDDYNKRYNGDKKATLNCIESYYKSLENLSKSLEAIKTLKDDIGIEEIASNKSSLKLEQHAHEFFQIVSKMFDVNAIVMLIDDVDMAFDKGFDVLEVVRKYLASPYLIPIVAGDMKLYREIVETRFKEKIQFFQDMKYLKNLNNDLKNSDEYKEKISFLNNLVEQYLHKVFPSEYHIKLKDIFSILKSNNVSIEINGKKISYKDLKDFEIRVINWGINQKEFTHQVFTNKTRDFVQYLYHKKTIFEKIFDKDYKEELYSEKDTKKSYLIITDRFDNLIKERIIKNPMEHKKTLKLTADFYRYANDVAKKRLSLLLDNDVDSFVFNKDNKFGYSIHKSLTGNFFLNEKLPYNKIDKEVIVNSAFLPKDRYGDWENQQGVEYLFLYLMLHSNFYSKSGNRELFITGKFVEAMICLLDKTLKNEEKAKIINNLEFSIPIFSNINKNKYIKYSINNEDNVDEGNEIEESIHENNFSRIIEDFPSISNNVNFTSIFLYEMLKKYINNINILKAGDYNKDIFYTFETCNATKSAKDIFENNPIFDSVKRVIYIFINSIASFESTNSIYTSNIAIGENINRINQSKVYKNIENIEKDSLSKNIFNYLSRILEYKNDIEDSIFNKKIKDTKFNFEKELKYLGFNSRTANHKTKLSTMKKLIENINNKKYTNDEIFAMYSDIDFRKKFIQFKGTAIDFNKTEYEQVASELEKLLNSKIVF